MAVSNGFEFQLAGGWVGWREVEQRPVERPLRGDRRLFRIDSSLNWQVVGLVQAEEGLQRSGALGLEWWGSGYDGGAAKDVEDKVDCKGVESFRRILQTRWVWFGGMGQFCCPAYDQSPPAWMRKWSMVDSWKEG